jgi:hypothetical protein
MEPVAVPVDAYQHVDLPAGVNDDRQPAASELERARAQRFCELVGVHGLELARVLDRSVHCFPLCAGIPAQTEIPFKINDLRYFQVEYQV